MSYGKEFKHHSMGKGELIKAFKWEITKSNLCFRKVVWRKN